MTVKEFLNQAYRLDQRIQSKIEQLDSLNALATKATSTLSHMPKNPNKATLTMENTICKIIDLQHEINEDIDRLVDLKTEIVAAVKSVENREYQTLLEKRYLCFETWEQIAVDMHYSLRWIHILHGKALNNLARLLN
jgi:hypothetical protein